MRGNPHVRFLGESGARKGPRLTRRRAEQSAASQRYGQQRVPAPSLLGQRAPAGAKGAGGGRHPKSGGATPRSKTSRRISSAGAWHPRC